MEAHTEVCLLVVVAAIPWLIMVSALSAGLSCVPGLFVCDLEAGGVKAPTPVAADATPRRDVSLG